MRDTLRPLIWSSLLTLALFLPVSETTGQSKALIDSTRLFKQLLTDLPLTKVKSRGAAAAKSHYEVSFDLEAATMTIEDQRLLVRNGKKNSNDGYIITIPLGNLHRDGILLVKDEDKGILKLSILASNNAKAFTVAPLLAKEGNLKFPQDRLLMGPWSTSNPGHEAQLERVRGLLSWIAKKEGTKKKKFKPSFELENTQVVPTKAVNSSALAAGSKATPRTALPIERMDRPPLFENARTLEDVTPAVEAYILKQLAAKDIQLKFAVQGRFIVNESGQVSFVKVDFAMDKGAQQLIERILKEMPTWQLGSHEGRTRSALIPFAIKAKQ
ncbi:MAG: hypothetical protein HRU41_13630 [Saprospiraceae bacterium]|nr:hypothetical protein [Saprospiraceae bacterium]